MGGWGGGDLVGAQFKEGQRLFRGPRHSLKTEAGGGAYMPSRHRHAGGPGLTRQRVDTGLVVERRGLAGDGLLVVPVLQMEGGKGVGGGGWGSKYRLGGWAGPGHLVAPPSRVPSYSAWQAGAAQTCTQYIYI